MADSRADEEDRDAGRRERPPAPIHSARAGCGSVQLRLWLRVAR
jgi:hypothetical protein